MDARCASVLRGNFRENKARAVLTLLPSYARAQNNKGNATRATERKREVAQSCSAPRWLTTRSTPGHGYYRFRQNVPEAAHLREGSPPSKKPRITVTPVRIVEMLRGRSYTNHGGLAVEYKQPGGFVYRCRLHCLIKTRSLAAQAIVRPLARKQPNPTDQRRVNRSCHQFRPSRRNSSQSARRANPRPAEVPVVAGLIRWVQPRRSAFSEHRAPSQLKSLSR